MYVCMYVSICMYVCMYVSICMYVCMFVCLFVRSGKLVVRIGAGRDLFRMELFCSTVKPEYPDSVTKALHMCF